MVLDEIKRASKVFSYIQMDVDLNPDQSWAIRPGRLTEFFVNAKNITVPRRQMLHSSLTDFFTSGTAGSKSIVFGGHYLFF